MGLFNFRPSVRPVPLEVHIHGFPGKHYCPRMATMNKPAYQGLCHRSLGVYSLYHIPFVHLLVIACRITCLQFECLVLDYVSVINFHIITIVYLA